MIGTVSIQTPPVPVTRQGGHDTEHDEVTTMKLTFTNYIDAEPTTVSERLDAAVSAGLDAAAARVATRRRDTVTTSTGGRLRIESGLDPLAGTDLTIGGSDRLTEVRVEVPWSPSDSGTTKLWAANRFAGVLTERLAA